MVINCPAMVVREQQTKPFGTAEYAVESPLWISSLREALQMPFDTANMRKEPRRSQMATCCAKVPEGNKFEFGDFLRVISQWLESKCKAPLLRQVGRLPPSELSSEAHHAGDIGPGPTRDRTILCIPIERQKPAPPFAIGGS